MLCIRDYYLDRVLVYRFVLARSKRTKSVVHNSGLAEASPLSTLCQYMDHYFIVARPWEPIPLCACRTSRKQPKCNLVVEACRCEPSITRQAKKILLVLDL